MTGIARTVGGGRQRTLRNSTLPPNLIFIMTDDEPDSWSKGAQLATRPIFKSRMVDQGMRFPNHRNAYNICAPDRAVVLSEGQYYWNNGVHGEGEVANFDYTRSLMTDLWGIRGNRIFNVLVDGKVLNGYGDPNTFPLPPNQMVDAADEFYILCNNLGFPVTPANDCTFTHGSTDVVSASNAFVSTINGHSVTADIPGVPIGATVSYVSASHVTLSSAFTGTTGTGRLYQESGSSEQSKSKYAMYQETFDQDGNSLGRTAFQANYNNSSPPSYGDYQPDHITTLALGFLNNVIGRAPSDGRYGKPFFMYLTPTVGHLPFQLPPVYTPDVQNRAARLAQYDSFIRDLYDIRTQESGTSTAIGTTTRVDGSGSWTAQKLTDTSKNWTPDQWVDFVVYTGTAMGVVVGNTATDLIIGEWLLQGSGQVIYNESTGHLDPSSDLNWSVTSAPSTGAYTLSSASPDIDQTSPTYIVGSGTLGNVTTYDGNNIVSQKKGLKEVVTIDDMIEALCSLLENQEGQYALENTYIVYTSDNGVIDGVKGTWLDKGFPPDRNFRSPLVIRGPGIAAGTASDFQSLQTDIGPTIMGLLGQTANMSRTPDGIDLSPYILGRSPWSGLQNRARIFNGNPSGSTKGVITGTYRYYHDLTPPQNTPQDMIFNWRKDPKELRNLWGTAEVGAGTGVGGGSASIQTDLVNLTAANYNTGKNGTALSGLHYP